MQLLERLEKDMYLRLLNDVVKQEALDLTMTIIRYLK
jgi:hypothetical protein